MTCGFSARDQRPQGDPETVIMLPTGTIVGLYIRGLDEHVMLGIHETRDGWPLSCAITNEVAIDLSQSNPRRRIEKGDE